MSQYRAIKIGVKQFNRLSTYAKARDWRKLSEEKRDERAKRMREIMVEEVDRELQWLEARRNRLVALRQESLTAIGQLYNYQGDES